MKRVGLLLLAAASATHAAAQSPEGLWIQSPDGTQRRSIPVFSHRGYQSVESDGLRLLGWTVLREGGRVRAQLPGGSEIFLQEGVPFVRWGSEVYQIAHWPYVTEDKFFVPSQLLVDLLPVVLTRAYRYEASSNTLSVLQPDLWAGGALGGEGAARVQDEVPVPGVEPGGPARGAERSVVVIDPGHGGEDPGTGGRSGWKEKDVALRIAQALADILADDPNLEIHLTRNRDVLVPLWERGAVATEWKGDRPGIFISIHANASASSSSTRGFETYFLSEARTDHARRVAALENSAASIGPEPNGAPDSDLGFILRELRNLGHQTWSALLAEMVQQELDEAHPGPNRGVKQGPFAVMTNALMPAVLVEVGFMSNREDEQLLSRESFHRDAAEALARSVRRFFERYPPGRGVASGGGP